jgi:RNA polymerase primary sigma factor
VRHPRRRRTARCRISDAAVKKLSHSAKKRGYVTHGQINSVLPSEEVNSLEIEDVLADETEVIEPNERGGSATARTSRRSQRCTTKGVRSSS